MDGWMERQTDGWIDGWMSGLLRLNRLTGATFISRINYNKMFGDLSIDTLFLPMTNGNVNSLSLR